VNVLDEVPQSYSHQRNPKLNQTRYTSETQDHEFVDLEVIKLVQGYVHSIKKGHAIMDCPFMPFHIRVGIVRHMELQNVARTLMDQP
jgi:hypothetical protein